MYYAEVWFWLLLVSLIMFIVSASSYESMRNDDTLPNWIWVVMGISFVLAIISIIVFFVRVRMEAAKEVGQRLLHPGAGIVGSSAPTYNGSF